MHPNPLFHSDDRAMIEAMIAQVGVGTVFGQTRTGPCAARTPLIVHGAGRLQYHLAKSNPLAGRGSPSSNARSPSSCRRPAANQAAAVG